jgi:hypothetical protein
VADRLGVVLVMTDYFSCARHPGQRRSRPHHDTGCQTRRDGNTNMTSVRTSPTSAELALTMATSGHDPQITASDGHRSALVRAPEDA